MKCIPANWVGSWPTLCATDKSRKWIVGLPWFDPVDRRCARHPVGIFEREWDQRGHHWFHFGGEHLNTTYDSQCEVKIIFWRAVNISIERAKRFVKPIKEQNNAMNKLETRRFRNLFIYYSIFSAQWFKTSWKRVASNGPHAHPLARSLTHLLLSSWDSRICLTNFLGVLNDQALRRSVSPKSAILSGSSLQDRGRWSNRRQWPGQFIGFKAKISFSISVANMFSA